MYPFMKVPADSLRILVTGSGGQLGQELRRLSETLCPKERFVFSDVRTVPGQETLYLDITSREAVQLVCESERIDVIVNCAGYTDVERAESDIAAAKLLNAEAPKALAEVARETGALLIHISTDFVFDGKRSKPYTEDIPGAPLSVYGATKWEGEQAILSSGLSSRDSMSDRMARTFLLRNFDRNPVLSLMIFRHNCSRSVSAVFPQAQ